MLHLPPVPPQTEGGPASLFHACSLAFWGVHDRTSLLREAVDYCLGDPKAQFLLYNRWSQQGGGKQVGSHGVRGQWWS